MDRHTFIVADAPDPEALGKYQLKLAKMKPQCMNCGKNLPAKLLESGGRHVCKDREACRVRSIFRRCTYANAA